QGSRVVNEGENLAYRIREVFHSGKWIANTNYQLLLAETTWEQAVFQLEGYSNSIAKLTYHLNYYLSGLNQAFETGTLTIQDKHSFDMPEVSNEDQWKALTKEILHSAEIFAQSVSLMSSVELRQPFIVEKYGTMQRNVEGVIEHAYYHLGQIAILKKLISAKAESP
ncbi:MAG: hypothetical protein AAF939_02750, partial [Planctomycetota bacterium]